MKEGARESRRLAEVVERGVPGDVGVPVWAWLRGLSGGSGSRDSCELGGHAAH